MDLEKNIIVVKSLEDEEGYEAVDKTAAALSKAVNASGGRTSGVAYGTIVDEIKEVSKSYKEARMALDVGKIFFSESKVIAYSSLGIGRLIYQLPIPLCKMFIREIFENKSPDDSGSEGI